MKSTSKSIKAGPGESISPPSIADTTLTEEDGKSMISLPSETGMHSGHAATSAPSVPSVDAGQQQGGGVPKPRKTKRQLWDDLTISGELRQSFLYR